MGMMAALGFFKAGIGISSAFEQHDIDEERVQLEYESNLEEIRRREFEMETIKGATKAFSENAGVLHTRGSTAQGYLDTMSYQFDKELRWMKEYAARARQLGMDQADFNRFGNILDSISGGISTGMAGK